MNPYEALWEHIQRDGRMQMTLSFTEIHQIIGMPINHAFLQHKKELLPYGYRVEKISLKEQTVAFVRINGTTEMV